MVSTAKSPETALAGAVTRRTPPPPFSIAYRTKQGALVPTPASVVRTMSPASTNAAKAAVSLVAESVACASQGVVAAADHPVMGMSTDPPAVTPYQPCG